MFFTTLGIVTGALIGLGAFLNPLRKKLQRFMQWMDQFMRDWEGEESAPGRDRVPGVMERLNKLDGELSNNGGKSTKDVVDKLFHNQSQVMETQEKMFQTFVEVGERLLAIENCLTNNKISTDK
jgi:hypothetical protein